MPLALPLPLKNLLSRIPHGPLTPPAPRTPVSSTHDLSDHHKHLAIASSYISHRLSARHAPLLALCSEDIMLTSAAQNTEVRGKKNFESYLERNKARGEWGVPRVIIGDGGESVEIRGRVRVLGMVAVGVVARFAFDEEDLIERIFVGRCH